MPLKDLPANWVHLPKPAFDAWTGVLHDSTTGAYVSYRVWDSNQAERQWNALSLPTDVIERGTRDYAFQLATGPNARRRYEALYAEDRLVSPEFVEQLLPPEGASFLQFQTAVERQAWSFESVLTTDDQAKRVRALLTSSRIDATPQPCDLKPFAPHPVRESDVAQIAGGEHVSGVLTKLGMPLSVQRQGDGFELTYLAASGAANVALRFGRDQRFEARVPMP